MAELTATTSGDRVVLRIQDDNGNVAEIPLDRQYSFAAMMAIATAAEQLPFDPSIPLQQERPVLKATDPSFQVGVAHSGNVLLTIRPNPHPTLEFEFPDNAATTLIDGLRRALMVVKDNTGSAH